MRRWSLFWKLYLSYLFVILLALLVIVVGDYTFLQSQWTTPLIGDRYLGAQPLALGGVVLAVLAAGLGLFTSGRITQPLQEMRRGAERFATGDFSQRLAVPDTVELGSLAATLNHMTEQLATQISVITQQRNGQEAILASMQEGVLALDSHEHVLTINRAAESLLGVTAAQAKGRTIQEVVRNSALQRLLVTAMHSIESQTAEIVLRGAEERVLQATATALRDASGRDIGVLVIMNDVTQLRHLENVRRDFVANVSHELKTPITSIKGFIETLRDGALDDRQQAERFLGIIARHADRLHAIIEDLLSLSRLEQESGSYDIACTEESIAEIIEAAMVACDAKATARQVTIVPSCAPARRVMVNAPLLEQALVNLLDNAIIYSKPGSTVWVDACCEGSELAVRVRDQGFGIPQEHHSRIFERFYRVDKARSRDSGGTGLGLAIVKHIAQVHGGHVSVASTVGQGSTFTLRLPQDQVPSS